MNKRNYLKDAYRMQRLFSLEVAVSSALLVALLTMHTTIIVAALIEVGKVAYPIVAGALVVIWLTIRK